MSSDLATQWHSHMPDIRICASEPMIHRPSESLYSPPAITNQWAMVQASRDITAYDDFTVPPVECGEGKYAELFFGFSKDDILSCEKLDLPITYQWFPHAVERKLTYKGLEIASCLSLSTRMDVLQMRIRITNTTEQRMDNVHLFLRTLFGLNCLVSKVNYDLSRNAFICHDVTGRQDVAFQSVNPTPSGYGAYPNLEWWNLGAYYRSYGEMKDGLIASYGTFYYALSLEAEQTWELSFVHAMGDNEVTVRREHDEIRAGFDEQLQHNEYDWNEEIKAAFTPNNKRFSGHLPMLSTTDPSLKRLYDMSCLLLLIMKRTRRMGEPALVYATGMPKWTSCFLWDAQMSSYVVALLDPAALKQMIRFWIRNDPSTFFCTDYVTREAHGVQYAINDYAMVFMMHNYLTVTGDYGWLSDVMEGKKVSDHFVHFASRFLDRIDDDQLVDFGQSRNLLECVFSYAHKVPAFNAGNVWCLRRAAELLQRLGNDEHAKTLFSKADLIARSVLSLYESGKGYWSCRYPNGDRVPVRTCIDYNYIFEAMDQDLPQAIKDEMVAFFKKELMTETWMHALSPKDPDTAYSARTDHQDDGAFASWPAYGLLGLLRAGYIEDALRWIGAGGGKGLATVTLQGPWGQAYFHGGPDSPMDLGAAMKAPKEYPHLERYGEISGSMFASVIIKELIGAGADWDGAVWKQPQLDTSQATTSAPPLKLEAKLTNFRVQNQTHSIDWSYGI